MAHVQKFTRTAAGHMTHHYDRTANNIGNDKVDPAKTELNYNLAMKNEIAGISQIDFINRRCSEVQCMNRDDVNVMCTWVITEPQELTQDEKYGFFSRAYDFLEKRYGANNVISAHVHMDETTPHMHFAFVPVVKDKKKGIEKVSAKEAVSRKDLQTFHADLDKHMQKAFGRDIGILNQATRSGNKAIDELKRGTALNDLEAKRESLERKIEGLEGQIKQYRVEASNLTVERDKVKNDINIVLGKINALEGKLEGLQSELQGRQLSLTGLQKIQPEKNLIGGIKNITLEDIENLKKTAFSAAKMTEAYRNLKELYDNQDTELVELREFKKANEPKKQSMRERLAEKQHLIKLEEKAKAFDKLPDNVKADLMRGNRGVRSIDEPSM